VYVASTVNHRAYYGLNGLEYDNKYELFNGNEIVSPSYIKEHASSPCKV